jgi:phytoene dehydrogenase-like protein
MAAYDVVVVGAGHNGLVAATYLARAGRSVLVVERASAPGGAVMSEELTRPGFVHDVFATNMNLFLGSPVAAELGGELERHGLTFAGSARPFANVFPGGRALRVHQDAEATRAGLRAHDREDAEGWSRLDALYERLSPALFALYGSRLGPRDLTRFAVGHAEGLGADGARELARLLVSSTRELGDEHMHTPEAKALLACWGMHLDYGPDVAGGAMFPFLEAFTDVRTGMALARGGASKLPQALAGLLREHGGELRLEREATRIHLSGGRATAVELADGERVEARHVIANLSPAVLFGSLLAAAEIPGPLRRAAARYRYGPGTMMVHLALSAPPAWEAGDDLAEFAYVHVAPSVDHLARTYAEATAGLLPATPLLVVGQTSAVDPTRARDGHVLWIQVRAVPGEIAGDAEDRIDARRWPDAAEPYADRVMALLEPYAPGLADRVLDRAVLSPADLERRNPNLVGGDSIAGSMHLRQNFLFRPFPEARDYDSGIPGLLLCGAATWPGAGVNALSGYHVAQKLIAPPARRGTDARLALDAVRAAGRLVRSRRRARR